ncbi:helix-turn-helix domain-containing protein [Paenibacillus sp. YN15]|uniref:helix-turn-helix domain-containing protein n=1 Tax=Paenibacillus sp. YN15 TaxID=1742774 RepID=UPI0015EB5C98|nr:AraC family transcriptional regulator [Paenibacillus sp. YN15]
MEKKEGLSMHYPVSIRSYGYSINKRRFVQPQAVLEEDWTLLILEEGSFRYSLGGQEGEAGPGEVLLGPPGVALAREALTAMNIHYLVFRPSRPEGQTLLERITRGGTYRFPVADRSRLLSSLRLIKPCSDRREEAALAAATHYLYDLLLLIMHEISEESDPSPAIPDPRMLTARRWLEANAFGEARLVELAHDLGISQVTLTRQFKAAFGTGPKEYLTALRLEKAKALLTDTDFTLEHVASLCGYDNGYYFSRIFEKTVKLRPSVYRRIYRF